MANDINKFLDKAGLTRLISWIKGALNSKQDMLTFDATPTTNSNNPVTSGGVKAAIDALGTPNEIASITTQESSASGGNNVVTITDTDGTVTTFNVKNGIDGQDGADGVSLGEIALVQTTGDSDESVMSQKAVTDALEVSENTHTITCMSGRLAYFEIADYPQLDPRTADGISIVFTTDGIGNERVPIFSIANPSIGSNNGLSGNFFGLYWFDGYLYFGCLRSYYNMNTGGYRFTRVRSHYVFTYDFKTGIAKCYKNGELSATEEPASWDEQTNLRSQLSSFTHIHLCAPSVASTTGIAIFGSVLTDSDVKSIYGGGDESIRENIIADSWKANNLHPTTYTNFGILMRQGSSTPVDGGGYTLAPSSSQIRYGFTGLSGMINNVTYEYDFEVTSGTCTYTNDSSDRAINALSTYYRWFTIYDSNGNNVTLSNLSTGTYHVVCKPNNVAINSINASNSALVYCFKGCSSDFRMRIEPNLKVTERGAALECSIRTYRGGFWELANGIKLPRSTVAVHSTIAFKSRQDAFMKNAVAYSNSTPPTFNGQIAIDTTNGKVYIGYLTSAGGTWKQVSN